MHVALLLSHSTILHGKWLVLGRGSQLAGIGLQAAGVPSAGAWHGAAGGAGHQEGAQHPQDQAA